MLPTDLCQGSMLRPRRIGQAGRCPGGPPFLQVGLEAALPGSWHFGVQTFHGMERAFIVILAFCLPSAFAACIVRLPVGFCGCGCRAVCAFAASAFAFVFTFAFAIVLSLSVALAFSFGRRLPCRLLPGGGENRVVLLCFRVLGVVAYGGYDERAG